MALRRTGMSIVAAASLWSLAAVKGSQALADVSFDLVQQHLIVVKGSVGRLHDLKLLIDTGSIPSMVDQRIAGKLRLHAEPSRLTAFGQTIQINSAVLTGLRLGPIEPGDVPAGVGDLSYLEASGIDAIIGLDVLARSSFRIDYKARRLSFAPRDRESAVVPLRILWPFVTVRIWISGHPMQLIVDTGSRDLVLFRSRLSAANIPLPWRGEKLVRHASGLAHLLRCELRQLRLGDQLWDKLPGFALDAATDAYPPGIDGVLGVLTLGGTSVQFDFERGELGWSR